MARKMKTMDGNHAAAHASYAFSECSCQFTRSPLHLVMAEATDEWQPRKKEHLWTGSTGNRDAV